MPTVTVAVGKAKPAFTGKKLPGATVSSTRIGKTVTLREGESHDFVFPDTKTKIYVERLSDLLSVTLVNHTTVSLSLTTRLNRDELTDFLAHGKKYTVPNGARVTVEA